MAENNIENRKIENIALRYRSTALNGKLTFVGVLTRYYDAVRSEWENSTSERYLSDYAVRLLNALPNKKALCDYTADDIKNVIKTINDDENISHYLHLMRHVVEVAEEYGICENIIFPRGKKDVLKESEKKKKKD